jgi:hypothetical protein
MKNKDLDLLFKKNIAEFLEDYKSEQEPFLLRYSKREYGIEDLIEKFENKLKLLETWIYNYFPTKDEFKSFLIISASAYITKGKLTITEYLNTKYKDIVKNMNGFVDLKYPTYTSLPKFDIEFLNKLSYNEELAILFIAESFAMTEYIKYLENFLTKKNISKDVNTKIIDNPILDKETQMVKALFIHYLQETKYEIEFQTNENEKKLDIIQSVLEKYLITSSSKNFNNIHLKIHYSLNDRTSKSQISNLERVTTFFTDYPKAKALAEDELRIANGKIHSKM